MSEVPCGLLATRRPSTQSARPTPAHCRPMPHWMTRGRAARSIQLPHIGPKTNCQGGARDGGRRGLAAAAVCGGPECACVEGSSMCVEGRV